MEIEARPVFNAYLCRSELRSRNQTWGCGRVAQAPCGRLELLNRTLLGQINAPPTLNFWLAWCPFHLRSVSTADTVRMPEVPAIDR